MSLLQPSLTEAELSRGEYSSEERALLLHWARESILSTLEDRQISFTPPGAHLAEPRGVFTSLHLKGDLRGCVGYVLPVVPLYQAVVDTARSAAFQDSRFCPVTLEEARRVEVELSILTPPKPITPGEIEVGRHGLVISMAGQRGLLLPQVAIQYGWDRVTLLEQTCRKAGLPRDAWLKGALVEAFTAEVFGEHLPY